MTSKTNTAAIAELTLAHAAETNPRKRGAITRQINRLQEQAGVSAADRAATSKGLSDVVAGFGKPAAKKQVKADPKPAAKKSTKQVRKPAAAKQVATGTAAAPLVWQARLDTALKAVAKGKEGVLTTCPTPKTATGTADKVRKLIAAGRIDSPAGLAFRVKSHGANVVAIPAA